MKNVLNVGNRLELLAAPGVIEAVTGSAALKLKAPVPREIIPGICHERDGAYRYMTVFQDGDLHRMYYALVHLKYVDGVQVKEPERICYAYSHDGKEWVRPELGLFSWNGSSRNNIVWMETGPEQLGTGGFSAFKDENPACDPRYRYKAIAEAGSIGKTTLGHNGLLALGSPDGIHWSMMAPCSVMSGGPGLGAFDSQNLAFWDAVRGEYRLYRREVFREGPLNVFRDVLTAISHDFLEWSPPERLCFPGAIPEQLYTNNIQPYPRAPHLFVGIPTRYTERPWSKAIAGLPEVERRKWLIRSSGEEPGVIDPTGRCGQRGGTALTDSLLMISRDGHSFHRWGEAFIRPGLRMKDNWFYMDNSVAWGMLETVADIEGAARELSLFVTEGARREGQSNRCRRYTIRVDGFASAHASRSGGEVFTCPLIFQGDRLVLNFSASAAGSVRVELQDARGWPLSGYGMEECVELLGDDLERVVSWKGGGGLASLAGQPVKLRFRLVDADLYSFRFQGGDAPVDLT